MGLKSLVGFLDHDDAATVFTMISLGGTGLHRALLYLLCSRSRSDDLY